MSFFILQKKRDLKYGKKMGKSRDKDFKKRGETNPEKRGKVVDY